MDIIDILCIADERQSDEVCVVFHCPTQVLFILLGKSRNGHRDAGKVQALVVGNYAGDLNLGDDVGIGDLDNADCDVSVVNQQAIAGSTVTRQTFEGRTNEFLSSRHVAGCDGERVTNSEDLGPFFERLQANLRALQVNEDCNGTP